MKYFEHIYNYFDLTGLILVLVYCILKETYVYPWKKEEEKNLQRMISFGLFICNLRLFSLLRVFSESLRHTVMII